MKIMSTILILTFAVTGLFAQITLTSSDFDALKGVTKNYAQFLSQDISGLAAVLAATGSGKTWSITGRAWGTPDSSSQLYSNYPADAPLASSFPSSNVVLKQITKSSSGTTTTWSFYKNSASDYVMYGSVTVQGVTQALGSYSTPVLAMKYPGILNASWSTTTNSTFSGFSTPVTYEYLIDGEGTITTPEGTFPCLRSKLKITTSVFGFNTITYNYTFLDKGRTYASITTDGAGAPISVSYWQLSTPTFVESANDIIPSAFTLSQNYPNPFNPSTSFQIIVSSTSRVALKIYDVAGKEVAVLVDQELSPGQYRIHWNAADHQSGTYLARLQTGSFSQSRKVTLVK